MLIDKRTEMIRLSKNGKCLFSLNLPLTDSKIQRNAAILFKDELRDLYGLDLSDVKNSLSCSISIIVNKARHRDEDQNFRLSTFREGEEWKIILEATGDRGMLYGLCEILDNVECINGDLFLPILNGEFIPDVKRRGTERHWGPTFLTDEGVEANLQLIRMLARNRFNVACWNEMWPAHWYPYLTMRYFKDIERPDEDGILKENKRRLNRIIEECNAWGIDFYLSCTEFNVPHDLIEKRPDMFSFLPNNIIWCTMNPGDTVPRFNPYLNRHLRNSPVLRLEHPDTWAFFRAKIREMAEDCPGLAGIELWTAEAMEVWMCHVPEGDRRTAGEWLLRMYEEALAALDSAGRENAEILARTFNHHPMRDRIYDDIIGRIPERVHMVHKSQIEDFYRFDEANRLAGYLAPGREWVEIDNGGEARGYWSGWFTNACRFNLERMREYYSRGIDKFICRIRGVKLFGSPDFNFPLPPQDFDDRVGLTSLDGIKNELFCRACWNIDTTVEKVWRMWNRKHGWPEEIFEVVTLAEEAYEKTFYINKALVNGRSSFTESIERYEWSLTFPYIHYRNYGPRRKLSILEPTEENIQRIIQEKDDALDCIRKMKEITRKCKDRLPEDDYSVLMKTFDFMEQFTAVMKKHVGMYFRFRAMCMLKGGETFEKIAQGLPKAIEELEIEIEKLRKYSQKLADEAYAIINDVKPFLIKYKEADKSNIELFSETLGICFGRFDLKRDQSKK